MNANLHPCFYIYEFSSLQYKRRNSQTHLFYNFRCYENVEQILREFYTLRLEYYGKRKKYLEGMIGSEAARLSNQARFILEKCDGTVKIENKKKQVMIDELTRRGYDSDPVKAWKKTQVDRDFFGVKTHK